MSCWLPSVNFREHRIEWCPGCLEAVSDFSFPQFGGVPMSTLVDFISSGQTPALQP